ncbi:6141_t:CDS:2, partial [Cetraspora pellucida]
KMVDREDDYNQSQGRENDYNQLQALFLSLVDNISDHVLETTHIVQKQNPKQKYSFGIDYVKKVLDYAVQVDKVDEFINYLEKFIEIMKDNLERQQKNIDDNEYLDIDNPIC